MSLKRNAENELQPDKDAKNMKIEAKKYVSKHDGSIDKNYTNIELICFLYEKQSNLIKVNDLAGGEIQEVRGINKFYCYVKYRQYTGEKKCDRFGGRIEKTFAEPEWQYLDCIRKKIFNISTAEWNAQKHESKQWAFAIDPIVIMYVEVMKPLDLIISTMNENEEMITFKQSSIIMCVKMKKDSNSFQLC
uniref:Uncharacterized protein n=1 Tax=Pithovirus LCPAC401 TaxID=2506595 RepID=A0A481ZCS0_9VIRU|nr:MAG: uncharacterized protein LCPAC401_00990 [Pithovirus LCPAC401]